MFTGAELVELIDGVIKIFAKGVKCDCKFTLLFLHVHKEAEEGWDNVIPAAIEELRIHLAFCLYLSLFSCLGRVDIVFFLISYLGLFLVIDGHLAILTNTKFLSCSLWQSQLLKHLLKSVLKFGARATWSCKLSHQLVSNLLAGRIDASIFKLDLGVDFIDIIHVGNDIGWVLTLWDVVNH